MMSVEYEIAHMNCDDMPPIDGVPARLLFDLVDVASYAVTFANEVEYPYDPNAHAYLSGVSQTVKERAREWLEAWLAQEVDAPAPALPSGVKPAPKPYLAKHLGVTMEGNQRWCDTVEEARAYLNGDAGVILACAPAPADPFAVTPEVRAALRAIFREDNPLNRYGGTSEKVAEWVRSWPEA